MSVKAISPSTDAWVDEAQPAVNHKQSAKLRLSGTSSNRRRAFIALPRPFPEDATILSAVLKLYIAGSWSGTQTITAKRVTGDWKENHVNWNNAPAVSATHSADATVTGESDEHEVQLDLADMLADVAAGNSFAGVRLELDASVQRAVYSSDYKVAALRPVLEIEWAVQPNAPVNLVPSGGLAVSKTKPVLGWQFSERHLRDEQRQAYSQVQISTTSDFSSPGYDSGWVANTESAWDMSTETYSIADNATRYWRVRVQDEAGITSEWSDAVSFERRSLGTLTLNNPADITDPTVDDLTPTIDWDFTGRTQESWSITLFDLFSNKAVAELYREPKSASTDTEFVLPSGLLKTGRLFLIRVRVWDDFERMARPGDPGYVEVEREFAYERAASGPDPVTALTATPDTHSPKVVIEFECDSMPDTFTLVVNGEEVETDIDPVDVFVSGTSYRFDYWGAIPREAATYEVERVVLMSGKNKHSHDNATDSATTDPQGIWLVDPDDSASVMLTGPDDDVQLRIGTVGTTYDILGGRFPVRIWDAVQGYRGTVQGSVGSKQERDDFLDLFGRLKPVRLVASDVNALVVMEEPSDTSPTRMPGDRLYKVAVPVFAIDAADTFPIAGG